MKRHLYPDFSEVFEDNSLLGIFYPLCKISDFSKEITEPLFLVSSNGLWTFNKFKSKHNSSEYTCFSLKNGKYQFNGDIRLYQGYEIAKEIFDLLNEDFKINGETYLSDKLKVDRYLKSLKPQIKIDFADIDFKYFMESFYSYSINKLHFEKTGEFAAYRTIIDGWNQKKIQEKDLSFEIPNDNSSGFADIKVNKEFLFPASIEIEKYTKIGYTVGSDFFLFGNDSYLLYDKQNNRVVCINHYA